MFRFYLFKEECKFVSDFRPVPTIEPPAVVGQGKLRSQAPLFKLIYSTNPAKRNLYVLQPIDLTKQFIESSGDKNECKESIA